MAAADFYPGFLMCG